MKAMIAARAPLARVVMGSVLALASAAGGQTTLYGVRSNGDLLVINQATGAAGVLGASGEACSAAVGADGATGRASSAGAVLTAGGNGEWADRITQLNRWSGAITSWATLTDRPAGYRVHGIAGTQLFYVLLKADQPGLTDELAVVEPGYNLTVVGSTGRSDFEGLVSVGNSLYALSTTGGRALYSINPATGAATLIGGGGYAGDERALAYLDGRGLLACGSVLSVVDPATGAATRIGATGFSDITGLAVVKDCYADCDHGGPPPWLSVNDFICFQTRFASGDPYCNCDLSTTPPVLNVNDFLCFMNAWTTAAGCF